MHLRTQHKTDQANDAAKQKLLYRVYESLMGKARHEKDSQKCHAHYESGASRCFIAADR